MDGNELRESELRGGELCVRSGGIIAMRLFDVANAIDLRQVEALWAKQPRPASSRGRLITTPPKAIAFGVPPVALALDQIDLTLGGQAVSASVTARVFDFGIISCAIRVPVSDTTFAEFGSVSRAMERTLGGASETEVWSGLLARLTAILGGAFVRPLSAVLQEDYQLAVAQEFSERLTAAALLERVDLSSLLSGETRPLSDGARAELMRQRFSYYTDDLVVLTWDRAFIYEPRGDSDVADVLEVANAQLLELRYYDTLLDDELPRMYELVENARRRLTLFSARRFAHLARRLYMLVAEVTELTEKVDNALQVTEDVYLARIYSAALDLYRVPLVGAAVNRKLSIIRDTYTALYDEASSGRAELMEAAVLVLIFVEIVLALVRH